MMNQTIINTLKPLAFTAGILSSGSLYATTLTFDFPFSVNQDIAQGYGSNVAADSSEFITTDGSGITPNIALAWAPLGATLGNVLELHSSSVWAALDPDPDPAGTHVLQFQSDVASRPDPTITFTPDAGFAVIINSLGIGHASDQSEPAYAWTITVERVLDDAILATHTTSVLDGGDAEDVTFAFNGDAGVAYRLRFDDGGANTFRGAIDSVSFSQTPIPEPSSAALLGLGALTLLLRRRV